MRHRTLKHLAPLSLAVALAATATSARAQPAFPGAEGFGATATGGRGGAVIKVTSLAESGPGTLREALATPGPRTIVFAVSGVIDLGLPNPNDPFDESDGNDILVIPYGDVTIAGQTAPGAGVTIRGRLYADYNPEVGNIIVRHVRIRPAPFPGGDGEQHDTLRFALNQLAIFDHVSAAFGVDENVDLYEGASVTVQWSEIAEAATQGHPEGDHNYGLLNYGGRASVHHNLFAHLRNRAPALATGPSEAINNVVYNVRHGFVNHNDASGDIMVVGNTFIQGPNDSLIPFFFDGGESASYWLADNCVDDPGDYTGCIDDPWSDPYFTESIGASASVRADAPFEFSGDDYVPVTIQSAAAAHDDVVDCAGAFPRDAVSLGVLAELEARSGDWGGAQADLMSGLRPGEPPTDDDDDGMADAWELEHGLDPNDGSDHATMMPSGYTAIETYINELADMIACGGSTDPTGGDTSGGDDASGSATQGSASGDSATQGSASGDSATAGSASGTVGDDTGSGGAGSAGADGSGGTASADETNTGCGCNEGPRSGGAGVLLVLMLGARRRRSSAGLRRDP